MKNKFIASLQHPFVKELVRLRKEKKYRREQKKVLITGSKLVRELIEAKVPIEVLLIEKEVSVPWDIQTITVTNEVMKKISGLQEPEPIAAVVAIPLFYDLSTVSHLLVLDGVADPGNLGTLLRTAKALGWEGVYLTENTCDPFNEKALRAAKGATFSLKIQEGSWGNFIKSFSRFTIFIADMEGIPLDEVKIKTPIALILSKESCGARKEAKQLFSGITIPMQAGSESLNVAAAGAILLYGLKGEK